MQVGLYPASAGSSLCLPALTSAASDFSFPGARSPWVWRQGAAELQRSLLRPWLVSFRAGILLSLHPSEPASFRTGILQSWPPVAKSPGWKKSVARSTFAYLSSTEHSCSGHHDSLQRWAAAAAASSAGQKHHGGVCPWPKGTAQHPPCPRQPGVLTESGQCSNLFFTAHFICHQCRSVRKH